MCAKEIQMEKIFVMNQKDGYKSLNSGIFAGISMTIVSGETKSL